MTDDNSNEININMSCCPPGAIGYAPPLNDIKPEGIELQMEQVSQSATTTTTTTTTTATSTSTTDKDGSDDGSQATSATSLPPLPCYWTGASLESKPQRVVVIFSDVYGLNTGNHKAVADSLAKRLNQNENNDNNDDDNDTNNNNSSNNNERKKTKLTTAVCMPDLFRGDPILQPWFQSHISEMAGSVFGAPNMLYKLRFTYPPAKIDAELRDLIFPWLAQHLPSTTVTACVGFCFGGWVIGRALAMGEECPFRAGIGMHPSFQPELLHLASQEALAERIAATQKPLLLLPAGNDDLKANSKVVEILAAARKVPPEQVAIEFNTMSHGWVTRANPADPIMAEQQERALQLTAEFIETHCS